MRPLATLLATLLAAAVAVAVGGLMCVVGVAVAAPHAATAGLRQEGHGGSAGKNEEGGEEDRRWKEEEEEEEEDKSVRPPRNKEEEGSEGGRRWKDVEDVEVEEEEEDKSVRSPQSKVSGRVGRDTCPPRHQDPMSHILNLMSHSVLVTSLVVTLITNINNNNNNNNNNDNNNNNNNNNGLTVNVVNSNMNEAMIRRREGRSAGDPARQKESPICCCCCLHAAGHQEVTIPGADVIGGVSEGVTLPPLMKNASNSTTTDLGGTLKQQHHKASSLPENTRVHMDFSSSAQKGEAAGTPWLRCTSWGVCVRLAEALVTSPAAWVTENLAISVLEVEVAQLLEEEQRVALRRAVLVGRRQEDCDALAAGCSWPDIFASFP